MVVVVMVAAEEKKGREESEDARIGILSKRERDKGKVFNALRFLSTSLILFSPFRF